MSYLFEPDSESASTDTSMWTVPSTPQTCPVLSQRAKINKERRFEDGGEI